MMKRYYIGLISLFVIASLYGCGGGSTHPADVQSSHKTIFYLQTYDDITDRYEGVEDVYYECGNKDVGYTNIDGAFAFEEGDSCTFYDLDKRRSYEYDRLYLSTTPDGRYAVGNVPYSCASGWRGVSDARGMFVFDPDYQSNLSNGDICRFTF